jgi:hypothetical protein
MVFGEWRLGNGPGEAQDLAERATAAGVGTAIGLQARSPPDPAPASLSGMAISAMPSPRRSPAQGISRDPRQTDRWAHVYKESKGAMTLTVPTRHAIDALKFVLGGFS